MFRYTNIFFLAWPTRWMRVLPLLNYSCFNRNICFFFTYELIKIFIVLCTYHIACFLIDRFYVQSFLSPSSLFTLHWKNNWNIGVCVCRFSFPINFWFLKKRALAANAHSYFGSYGYKSIWHGNTFGSPIMTNWVAVS